MNINYVKPFVLAVALNISMSNITLANESAVVSGSSSGNTSTISSDSTLSVSQAPVDAKRLLMAKLAN